MKKATALLLLLLLLVPAWPGLADHLVSRDIAFGSYALGSTYRQVRQQTDALRELDFYYYPRTTRMLGDARLSQFHRDGEYDDPTCFVAVGDTRRIAGLTAYSEMYFVYPQTGGETVWIENEALLYAAAYRFTVDSNYQRVYQNVLNFLTENYGTPYLKTKDADDIWGPIGESVLEHQYYNPDYNGERDTYVVWKSSTNGALVILRAYYIFGYDEPMIDAVYLYPALDPLVIANMPVDNASTSLRGL